MNFYKHYIGDFQRDTGHLSLTERGAYLCLIHHYYATERPLPNDHVSLCRVAGAQTKDEKAAVRVAMGFFEAVESGLMHSRIEAELHKAGEISNTNREIALAREAQRRAAKTNHEPSTIRGPSVPRIEHEQSTPQTPDTRHQTNARKTVAAPPSPAPAFEPDTEGHEPTAAGLLCRAIKAAGIADVNPWHSELLRLIGVIPRETFVATAAEIVGKGKPNFAYLLRTVENRWREAQAAPPVPTAPQVGLVAVAETARLLREQAEHGKGAQSAAAHEARRAAMAKVRGVAA